METVDDSTKSLSSDIKKLEEENKKLKERIRLLERALFGQRSERVVDDSPEQLLLNDLLDQVDKQIVELADKERELLEREQKIRKATVKKRKRRSFAELLEDADLEEEITVLDVPEKDRVSIETGEPLKCIGEDRTVKIAYIPSHYVKKITVRPKYADPANPLAGIICAPVPETVFPESHFDESFAASVVVDKCCYHLPIYRQVERLNGLGIDLSRQTITRLYMTTAEVLLPLYDLIKGIILTGNIIFTDDTKVNLQVKGKGKTVEGRMWVYIAGGNSPPYRLYQFTADRSGKHSQKILENFSGYIHADGFSGYDKIFQREDVYECGCWMHIRRKFFEATDDATGLRRTMLAGIRLIYTYERRLKLSNATDAEILKVRQEKTLPLIKVLRQRVQDTLIKERITPTSNIGKAITYMQNLGDAVETFTGNAQLKPDNGESERAIKPLVIGRKNWMFAGSEKGGDATGTLMTIIQTCRTMGIEPFTYLEDVLRKIPSAKNNSAELEKLLPHNWQSPKETPDNSEN